MQRYHRFTPLRLIGLHPYNNCPHQINGGTLTLEESGRPGMEWRRRSFGIIIIGSSANISSWNSRRLAREASSTNINLEKKQTMLVLSVQIVQSSLILQIDHGNSFQQTQRIISYGPRFIKNTHVCIRERAIDHLTAEELEEALGVVIRTA